MDYAGIAALIVALCAGVAQIIVATATLMRVLRTEAKVETVGRSMNGRLDLLLAEREMRLRAEHSAEIERLRVAAIAGLGQPVRPEGVIRMVPKPEGGESGST